MQNFFRLFIFSLLFGSASCFAQISGNVVKIGVLTDMSGPYSDLAGKGSVIAAKMAIDEFGGKVLGKPVELVSADDQNKADVGSGIARRWFEQENVDMIADLMPSPVALAVAQIAKQNNKVVLVSGAGTTALSGANCVPSVIHWGFDSYALAAGTGSALAKQYSHSNWYFLTADYAFGTSLEKDASDVVLANGGKIIGSSRHPVNNLDYSSYVLKAQASGADVIALANGGGDTVNSLKQAREFGLTRDGKQKITALLLEIADVHGLGLKVAQGIQTTTPFYWDYDEKSRAWSKRFFDQAGRMPGMIHASVYSSVLNYLKAVEAAGTDETNAVIAKLREKPINDVFARNGQIRADNRMTHDYLLAQVKTPAESKRAWDYFKIQRVIPANEAAPSLALSACPLVKK